MTSASRVGLAVLLTSRIAAADPRAAEAMFERGLALMKEAKYEQACAQFKASLAEDFQYGALYVLASCETQRGHFATAWRAYQRLAAEDTNADRRKRSAQLADELAPRMPKLQIVVEPRPPSVAVTVDGTDVTAEAEVPVDLGERVVVVSAPGYDRWQKTVTIVDEGKTVRVEAAPVKRAVVAPRAAIVHTWHHRAGQGTMIAGGAIVVAGLVAGTVAWRTWDDAESAGRAGDRDAIDRADSARTWGNAATVLVGVGIAAGVTGFVLWRKGTHTVMVNADAEHATAIVSGHF